MLEVRYVFEHNLRGDALRDIDRVIIELQRAYPVIACEQLRAAHPGADDDGIWFFTHPEGRGEVQLESSCGELPFLVEGTDSASVDHARTIEQATSLVAARLGLPRRARE